MNKITSVAISTNKSNAKDVKHWKGYTILFIKTRKFATRVPR